jgi:hypothetical protein
METVFPVWSMVYGIPRGFHSFEDKGSDLGIIFHQQKAHRDTCLYDFKENPGRQSSRYRPPGLTYKADFCFHPLHVFRIDQEMKQWHFLILKIAGFSSLVNTGVSKPNKEENSPKAGEGFIIGALLWSWKSNGAGLISASAS